MDRKKYELPPYLFSGLTVFSTPAGGAPRSIQHNCALLFPFRFITHSSFCHRYTGQNSAPLNKTDIHKTILI
jgi:hypothetical protein